MLIIKSKVTVEKVVQTKVTVEKVVQTKVSGISGYAESMIEALDDVKSALIDLGVADETTPVDKLDDIVRNLLKVDDEESVQPEMTKLATPIIRLEETNETTAILGKAILGYAVLGDENDAEEEITKLDTPVIKLEDTDEDIVIEKLSTPTIKLVEDELIIYKLDTPVIDIMEV